MEVQTTSLSMQKNRAALTKDEAQIQQLLNKFMDAFRDGKANEIMSFYAPDVVAFDIVPPLQVVGKDEYKKSWEYMADMFKSPMDNEVSELEISASGDVGFSHSLTHFVGTMKDGQKSDFWMRHTGCYRKINGQWLIVHEHVSLPIDMETGKARLDLNPPLSAH